MPLARRLAAAHPVYVPDLPGFGRSAKPRDALPLRALAEVLVEWMRSFALRGPVMAGNSFGCEVITEIALASPRSLAAGIFLGPTIDRRNRTARQQAARFVLTALREPRALTRPLAADYLQAGIRRPLQTLRDALHDPVEAKLPRVDVPVLVMRGENDAITPQRWAEEVAALLPRGELRVVPGGAHVLNFDSATPVAAAIEDFVVRLPVDPAWQRPPGGR